MQLYMQVTLYEADDPPVFLRPVSLAGDRYHLIIGDEHSTSALNVVGTLPQLSALSSRISGLVATQAADNYRQQRSPA